MTRAIPLLTGVTALVLVWCGFATFPSYALLAWAVMSAMIGLVVWQRVDESLGQRIRVRPSRVGAVSAVAAFVAGVLAAEILLTAGILLGSGILAVLAAVGWWAAKRVRSPGPRGRRSVSIRSALPDADVAELCLVWRRSHEELRRTPDDDPARAQLAVVRQLLLDELERRDPAGFARWLENGALAGSDPLPFIRAEHGLTSR
ncbi:hypothetical protein QRX60_31575 [Amycolatopsis mongoliensis]|uniref:Uncharacterized protein n=1 Tax=Amycolatopsis mongoliensis TaxID=715475 RepID=A0A9Y2NGE6_9PSEU|nr:hypothetical protein [Amycolatopsis sp. 4-36]WIX98592.1 hypothetical protein QRX60_31575 [Amycolatopsis sp. 4-36]